VEQYGDAATDLKTLLGMTSDAGQRRKYAIQLQDMEKKNAEHMEKQKEEVLGKLKDLGNMFLGNFGMSLDNFQAVQDPVTGSYSISMKK